MTQVFISYSREDQAFVTELEPKLEALGLEAWTDRDLEGGDKWKEMIDKAIIESFAMLVVMTPTAKQSEYVTYEWSYALGKEIPVIPLMLIPTPLHPKLEELQYYDFTGDHQAPLKKLIKQILKLEYKYLVNQLKNRQYLPRLKAIKRLGELKAKDAVPQLIQVLERDRSKKIVCPAAAEALEKIGTPEALEAVAKWRAKP